MEEHLGEENRSNASLDATGNRQQGLHSGQLQSRFHRNCQWDVRHTEESTVMSLTVGTPGWTHVAMGNSLPAGVPLVLPRPPTPLLAQRDLHSLSPANSVSPVASHHLQNETSLPLDSHQDLGELGPPTGLCHLILPSLSTLSSSTSLLSLPPCTPCLPPPPHTQTHIHTVQ